MAEPKFCAPDFNTLPWNAVSGPQTPGSWAVIVDPDFILEKYPDWPDDLDDWIPPLEHLNENVAFAIVKYHNASLELKFTPQATKDNNYGTFRDSRDHDA